MLTQSHGLIWICAPCLNLFHVICIYSVSDSDLLKPNLSSSLIFPKFGSLASLQILQIHPPQSSNFTSTLSYYAANHTFVNPQQTSVCFCPRHQITTMKGHSLRGWISYPFVMIISEYVKKHSWELMHVAWKSNYMCIHAC